MLNNEELDKNKLNFKIDNTTINYIALCWSKITWVRRIFQILYWLFTFCAIALFIIGIIFSASTPLKNKIKFVIDGQEENFSWIIFVISGFIQIVLTALIKPFIKKSHDIKETSEKEYEKKYKAFVQKNGIPDKFDEYIQKVEKAKKAGLDEKDLNVKHFFYSSN